MRGHLTRHCPYPAAQDLPGNMGRAQVATEVPLQEKVHRRRRDQITPSNLFHSRHCIRAFAEYRYDSMHANRVEWDVDFYHWDDEQIDLGAHTREHRVLVGICHDLEFPFWPSSGSAYPPICLPANPSIRTRSRCGYRSSPRSESRTKAPKALTRHFHFPDDLQYSPARLHKQYCSG
jgi:hypothetical protein